MSERKMGYRELMRKTFDETKEETASKARELRIKRTDLFVLMGDECCRCGFSDKRALQIDHVEGDGKFEMDRHGNYSVYYTKVAKSFLNNENRYQLLCANCNWIKRVENKEHIWSKSKVGHGSGFGVARLERTSEIQRNLNG